VLTVVWSDTFSLVKQDMGQSKRTLPC